MLSLLSGVKHLVFSLLYGSGLRLMECLRLRVKDIDFAAKHIIVGDGKEFKDRVTILPESIIPELKEQLVRVKALHEDFLRVGVWRCGTTVCSVSGVYECGRGVGMAVCVSSAEYLYRSEDGSHEEASYS